MDDNRSIGWAFVGIGGICLGVLVWTLLSGGGFVFQLALFGSILLVTGIYMLQGREM